MEWNQCVHLGFPIDTILARFDPEVILFLQISAQSDQRFGKRCRKLIFKMAAVAAILDFLLAHLAILCLLEALILIIVSIQLDYRGEVQNMNSQPFSYINV